MAPPPYENPEDAAAVSKYAKTMKDYDGQFEQTYAWLVEFNSKSTGWTGDAATATKAWVGPMIGWYSEAKKTLTIIDGWVTWYAGKVTQAEKEIKAINKEYKELPEAKREAAVEGFYGRFTKITTQLNNDAIEAGNALKSNAKNNIYRPAYPSSNGLPYLPPIPLPTSVVPSQKNMPRVPGGMKRGSNDAPGKSDVRLLQTALKERGWNIEVDGKFGPQTEAVIRQFQTNKDLPVTGKVGWTTWNALWTKKIVH